MRHDSWKRALALLITVLCLAQPLKAQQKTYTENPFRLGVAGYTFVNFDLETTLRTMQRLDLHWLCIKDFHLPLDATEAQIADFHALCAQYGVKGYAVGPIYMRSEQEIDRAFAYATRVGVRLIVGVPNRDLLPYVEKKVKEYDYKYAIHLHGPDIDIYQDADGVWADVKDLDARIGMCLDVGHDLRNGKDPVADVYKYAARIFDVHIKDVTHPSKAGVGIEMGRGLINIRALVDALRHVGYTGMCSLEYEKDMKDPFFGIAESIGYFKAMMDYKAQPIMRMDPYLQRPVDGGITVMWMTNCPAESWVEYGTDPDALNGKQQTFQDGQLVCNNTLHKIRLEGLEPGKTYYYRVASREIISYRAYSKEFGLTAYSPVYSFTLPDARKSDFTALVFNDLHNGKELLRRLMETVTVPYDFVLVNGDFLADPKDEATVVDFLSYLNKTVQATSKPIFFIRGNHEIRNAYSIEMRRFFDYVGGNTYGAFSWGDTRFVLLDCGEDKPDDTPVYYGMNDFAGLRAVQADFLKQEINGPAFKKAAKRVLLHHIPVYGLGGDYNPCATLWGPILNKAPFNVSINAHTHRFAYHPKGSAGNPFPVVIGGGNRVETASVMIVTKAGSRLSLTAQGVDKVWLEQTDF